MKTLILVLIVVTGMYSVTFSQVLIDENTFITSEQDTIRVGDDLSIGNPLRYGEFSFIENATKNNIGMAGKLARATSSIGLGVMGMGAANTSAKAVMTGAKVATTAETASEVAGAADVVTGNNNELTGRKMRVLRFDMKGNKKRGEFFYAIVAGPKNQNYRIELIPAIENGEITLVNGKSFNRQQ